MVRTSVFLALATAGFLAFAPQTLAAEGEVRRHVLMIENAPALDGVPYLEDPIVVLPLLDYILPGDCAEAAAVPTGMTVAVSGQDAYPEHVCSIPACSYDGEECIRD